MSGDIQPQTSLDQSSPPTATVVISTRNRLADLRNAIRSCLEQTGVKLEILVYDDASTDGTAETTEREFPGIGITRSDEHVGYITLRNRGFREATGDIVFSIDDDAFFTSADTVARTLELFDEHPRAAAIALPYVEPYTSDRRRLISAVPRDRRLRGFVGCAHAMRRDVVIRLGGYREFFVHQGEERDLAIRLLDQGYEIVFGDTPPIVHTVSSRRDRRQMSFYGVRNTLLFDVLNIPLRYLFPRLAADAFNLFRYKLTIRTLPSRLYYVVCGLAACVIYWPERAPVRPATYRRYRALPGHGPLAPDAVGELAGSIESHNHGEPAELNSISGVQTRS